MPALVFSKSAVDGKYLACNQLFAEFVNKKCPEEVVGLTDYSIFEKGTADCFASQDRIALAMDGAYNYFEDVTKVDGSTCRLQTSKLTFVDGMGRLCILGMCMDVTEVMRVTEENERTKAAYEEALSTSAIYESIVEALSQDYFDLYYVDIETDEYVEYGSRTEKGRWSTERHGTGFFEEYQRSADKYIYDEDLERIKEVMSKERLLAEVERHGSYIYQFRLLIDGVPAYVNMKAVPMEETLSQVGKDTRRIKEAGMQRSGLRG